MAAIADGKVCGIGDVREIFKDIGADYDSVAAMEPMRMHDETVFYDLDNCDENVLNDHTEFISIGAPRPIEPRRLIRPRLLGHLHGPRCRDREWHIFVGLKSRRVRIR